MTKAESIFVKVAAMSWEDLVALIAHNNPSGVTSLVKSTGNKLAKNSTEALEGIREAEALVPIPKSYKKFNEIEGNVNGLEDAVYEILNSKKPTKFVESATKRKSQSLKDTLKSSLLHLKLEKDNLKTFGEDKLLDIVEALGKAKKKIPDVKFRIK